MEKQQARKQARSAKAAGQPAQKKRPSSKLTLLLLALLLAGFGIQLYNMYGQLQTAQQEELVVAEKLAELREENERLRSDIENSGDIALIEDIARDQLGYASPGEKVFRFGKG